jgi:nucleotide-binding universal stress UspA family protein
MADYNKPVVVPWDFSELADYALQHAENIAKIIKCDILLVHIVKKNTDIPEALEKMNENAVDAEKKYGIKPKIEVKEGSIFTAITEIIEETHASFAVMGTHGMKGMQKFTGSWALKVIIGSRAPFIVVQAPPDDKNIFDNVVFPVDFKFEEKEKLRWADLISKLSKTKFHLVYQSVSDPGIRKKVHANAIFAQKYLSDKGIDFEVVKLEGKGSLADEALKFAEDQKAGLVLIATTKNIRLQDYVLGADEQKIIANKERIPVMCINPREDLTKTGGLT